MISALACGIRSPLIKKEMALWRRGEYDVSATHEERICLTGIIATKHLRHVRSSERRSTACLHRKISPDGLGQMALTGCLEDIVSLGNCGSRSAMFNIDLLAFLDQDGGPSRC